MMTEKVSSPRTSNKSGSPQSGGPVFLTIGKLQRTHGVKGEILMEVLTDFPERINSGNTVFIGAAHKEYSIASIRPSNDKLLISFIGFTDCDQVSILRNQMVYIKTEDANLLPEGEYYHYEVLGMQVFDENQKAIGVIKEILVTGANDVYIISSQNGEELLLPAIRSAVLSVDRQSKKMIVRLPEWE